MELKKYLGNRITFTIFDSVIFLVQSYQFFEARAIVFCVIVSIVRFSALFV
ncbi:MAG TPA: hypothetical protein VHO47_04270 [Candidatus Babeliales bacterium]|nr:hypothetical protein [Candidatus Babeliales bacterium]